MNKNLIIIIAALILCMSFASAVRPDISVLGYKIKEGSAEVGKEFTLQLTISNKYPEACARSIMTNLQSGYPFITKQTSRYVGDICLEDTSVVEFPITIDPTATGGFYQLTVLNSFESITLAQFSSTDIINIYVNGTPELTANIVGSNPIDVYPGDTATVTFNIKNDGTFQAQSVDATLTAAMPLEVKWSKSYNSLGKLESQQGKTADFQVEVPKDALAKDYPMSLVLNYKDEEKNLKTKKLSFDLHVKPKAMFEILDDGSDSLYANQNAKKLRFQIKNTGTDAARNIKIRLQPMFPFSTDGSVKYIDRLEPGKSAPVNMIVDLDKDGTPGKYGLDILVDFEDGQGKGLKDTAKVSLDLKNKNIFVLAIEYWYLIAIAAFIFYMRNKKMQEKKKK